MTAQPHTDLVAVSRSRSGVAPMKRIALASFVGSTVEFYDFFIYGTAAALVFSDVFFPALGTAEATAASFATLGVAFVARPFGAILFGHFGDRLGRKKTLVTTLVMMGVATVLVGLMPTADQIGVAAPIGIVLLRIVQGLAAGGEWAGASLFAAENAPKDRRGFWAMFPSLGGGAALVLGNLTFLGTSFAMNDDEFADFGWRIPFLASIVLIGVGMFVRLKIEETPVFRTEQARSGSSGVPFLEAMRHQSREILLAAGTVIMVPCFTYIGGSYLTKYGRTELDLNTREVLAIGCVGGLTISLGTILGGTWSDRVGRRRVILLGALLAVPWALALFPLIDTGSYLAFAAGVAVTMFISGIAYGPMSAFMSELFHTRYRYTASGFTYNVAQIVGGAVPPLIAAPIISATSGLVFSAALSALCLVSLICILLLRETKGDDLNSAAAQDSARRLE